MVSKFFNKRFYKIVRMSRKFQDRLKIFAERFEYHQYFYYFIPKIEKNSLPTNVFRIFVSIRRFLLLFHVLFENRIRLLTCNLSKKFLIALAPSVCNFDLLRVINSFSSGTTSVTLTNSSPASNRTRAITNLAWQCACNKKKIFFKKSYYRIRKRTQ